MTSSIDSASRVHPQWASQDTVIDTSSFFGRLRSIYSSTILKAQLEQLKRSGCYDLFTGKWLPIYDTRRLQGGKSRLDTIPPSLFWESDIGKWVEAACYFLANPSSASTKEAKVFELAIEKLIGEIEAFQRDDGYLDVYFTVVDPAGKFKNLRDMHEMYNAGHLLEAAIAHYRWSGSRRFLDVMIKNLECFMNAFGPAEGQRPGYPGHPELELAVLRLYSITKDPRHQSFVEHMLSARGTRPASLGGQHFFVWEALQRDDPLFATHMKSIDDIAYNQAHEPLHDQGAILGHSVRGMYLLTACADFGGDYLEDAKRLWIDATQRKMYITGGIGSEPRHEGFSELPYYLPNSTGEGGCYAETCASIALMMLSERLLSHELHGKYRDVLELCLYNAVLGGGSLDGKGFSYDNKLATYGNESALRSEWYEVCCCPPNLCRTMGLIPGYIWSGITHDKFVELNVYLYISAERTFSLPNAGGEVKVSMESAMPWTGSVTVAVDAPPSAKVVLRLPVAEWMSNAQFSLPTKPHTPGFVEATLDTSNPSLSITFDLHTRLIRPHPKTHQDTLSVMRGPIVFVAESIDNSALDASNPHFESVGISESAKFEEIRDDVAGIEILKVRTADAYTLDASDHSDATGNGEAAPLWSAVRGGRAVRSWTKVREPLTLVPWFARGNRGGEGRVRVPFMRAGVDQIK